MNKKIFIIIFMMFLLVGSFSFVLAADSSGRLQIWRNASTDANVSWVDNNGNWNMVGNVTSSWFKGIFNWIVGSTSSNYLTFNGTQLDFSESAMNTTIDSRIVISEPDLNVNDSEYLDSYDSSFFMPLNTSVTGDFDFNGGWTSGGVSIIDGDFYGQTAYFYNITGLDVNTLKVNGSLVPQKGFDNQFDLGNETLRWRDLYLGGEVRSNGTGDNYFLGNVGIGTNSPSVELEIYSTSGDLQFSDDVKQSGGDAFNIFANGANLEISSGSSSRNLYLAGGDGSTNHMIIHNSGNIGIGNTTPANKLIVVGDVNITTNLSVGGTTFLVNSDDGRVGIGTTSPTALLDVSSITKATGGVMHITSTYSGSDWVAGDEIGTLGFYSSDPSDVGLKAKIVAVGETAGNYPADTELAFYTTTIGTAGLTEQMRIDDSGNVGIGTSSPGQKLDIDGGNVMVKGAGADQWIQIDSDDSARFLADASNADASIEFQEDDSLKWSVGFDYSADNTNPPLMISEGAPGTNTRLTILNGGNVGIGTSSPENFLHVNASTVNTVAQFESTDAGASIAFVDSASASVTDNTIGVSENKLIFRANGDERMRIDSSGNVGIGVLTPSTKLEINQSADDDGIKLYGYDDVATDYGSIYLDSNGRLNLDSVASGTDVIYLRASGTAVANFNAGYSRVAYDNLAATFGTTDDYGIGYNSTDDTLQFVDGSAVGTNVRMVIDNGGYVGIGTTDPKRRLHLEDSSSNQSLLISTTGNSGRFVQLRVNSDDHELGWDNGDNFHFGVFDNFNDDSITSYLSILGASGNVGIGNTTPASKLVVVGDANVTGNLYVAGNLVGDGVINSTAWNRSGTNVSLRSPGDNISATTLFVDNSAGRVGVGTVSPDTPLDIEADNGRMLRLARTTASGTGMLIQDTDTGSGTTNGFLIGISDAEVAQLWNYENTDMIFATNNAQKMVIEAGGNVGIGESNPDETLTIDLSGANNQIALNANANRQSAITFRSAGTDKWYVGRGDSDILSEDTFFIGKYGGSVNDAGGNTAKLVIDSSGNVGIGNTTPANKLIVVGDANVTGNFSAGGTTFLVDNDDGRVGIGTASPSATLHVAGTIKVGETASGNTMSESGNSMYLKTSATSGTVGLIVAKSNGGTIAKFESSGNVGIGTLTPTNLFNVLGDANITGNLYVAGNLVGDGLTNSTAWNRSGTNVSLRSPGDNISATTLFVDNSNGRVGIGTVAPSQLFQLQSGAGGHTFLSNSTGGVTTELVSSASSTNIVLDKGISGADAKVQFKTAGSLNFEIGVDSTPADIFKIGRTNNNADFVIDTSGNVGIGTTGPNATLEVINGTTQGGFMVSSDSQGAGDLFLVDEGGNVGIGTSSPSRKLHVALDGGTIPTEGVSGTTGIIINNNSAVSDDVAMALISGTSGQGEIRFGDQDDENRGVILYEQDTDLMKFRTSGTGIDMTIDDAGNVGIGTISPDYKLDITGTVRATSTVFGNQFKAGTGTVAGNSYSYLGNGNIGMYFPSNVNLGFTTDGVERIRIDDSGNVGIGTSSPDNPLTVVSDGYPQLNLSSSTAAYSALQLTTATSTIDWRLIANSNNNFAIYDVTNTSYRFVIDGSGNVGIGTSSPLSKLNINNNGTFALNQGLSLGDGDSGLYESSDDAVRITAGASYYEFTGSYFHLGSGNRPALRRETTSLTNPTITPYRDDIDTGLGGDGLETVALIASGTTGLVYNGSSGNVGIGTSSPNGKLQVVHGGTNPDGLDSQVSRDVFQISGGFGTVALHATNTTGVGDTYDGDLAFMNREYSAGAYRWEERMRIRSDGNVGIGTATPQNVLNVIGDANITGDLFVNGANVTGDYVPYTGATSNLDLGANNLSVNTNTLFVDSTSGNVGIGTINPSDELHINGNNPLFRLSNSAANGVESFIQNVNTSGINAMRFYVGGYGMGLHENAGVSIGGSYVLTSPPDDGAIIQGNVGIGTTSPTYELDVAGDIGVDKDIIHNGDTDTYIRFQADDVQIIVGGATAFHYDEDTINNLYLDQEGTADISLGGNMFVGGSGGSYDAKVGIGTTSPTSLLDVAHGSYVNEVNLSGTLFVNSTSGNVGIGTSSPYSKLFVASGELMIDYGTGGATDGAALRLFSNADHSYIATNRYYDGNTKYARTGGSSMIRFDTTTDATAGNIDFYTSASGTADATITSTQRMIIEQGGNVGIGTTGPNATLEVINGTTQGGFMVSSDSQGAGDLFIVDESGNVGINTTDPGARLDIYGTSGNLIRGYSTTSVFSVNYAGDISGQGFDMFRGTTAKIQASGGKDIEIIPNANLDILLEVSGTGKVGVGTTTPTSLFDVGHVSQTNEVNLSNTLFVNSSSGFVGIGTASPTQKLQVEDGNIYARGDSAGEGLLIQDSTGSTGTWTITRENTDASNGYLKFGTPSNEAQDFYFDTTQGNFGIGTSTPDQLFTIVKSATTNEVNLSDTLFLNSSAGNVGIGTSTPVKNLTISYGSTDSTVASGNGLGGGAIGSGVLIHNSDATADSYANLDFRSYTADGRIAYVYNGTTNYGEFHFITDQGGNYLDAMVIDADGKVGIGTTSPNADLQIGNANDVDRSLLIRSAGIEYLQLAGSDAGVQTIKAGSTGVGSSELAFWTAAAATGTEAEAMRIDDAGRLGIGTSSPDSVLHLHEPTASTAINLKLSSAVTGESASDGILLGITSGGEGILYNQESTNLHFGAGGASADMTIQYDGNVGIGVANPTEQLAIGGSLLFNNDGVLNISYDAEADNTHYDFDLYGQSQRGFVFTPSKSGDRYVKLVGSASSSNEYFQAGDDDESSYTRFGHNNGNGYVDSTANFGVNTKTPVNTLNVLGDANVTGNLYVAGNLIGDGSINSTAWNRSGTNVSLRSPGDNISATTLFVDNSVGRIGIGTVAPSQVLDVQGNINIPVGNNLAWGGNLNNAIASSSDSLRFYANVGERMRIESDGNVGIGTTDPKVPLEVVEEIRIDDGTGVSQTARLSFTDTPSRGQLEYTTSLFQMTSTKPILINNTGTTDVTLQADNGDIILKPETAGGVGIGTSSPSVPLHVLTSTAVTDGAVNSLRLEATSTGSIADGFGPQISFSVDDGGMSPSVAAKIKGIRDGGDTEGALAFLAGTSGNEEFMRIDNAGNVGIGTSTPGEKLQIAQGSIFLDPGRKMIWDTNEWIVGDSSNDGSLRFFTNSAEKMVIESGGNVGIGTSSPGATLDVNGSVTVARSTDGVGFTLGKTGTYSSFVIKGGSYFKADASRGLLINNDADTLNLFKVKNAGGITVYGTEDSSFAGNVGIGTSSPLAKTHILGDTGWDSWTQTFGTTLFLEDTTAGGGDGNFGASISLGGPARASTKMASIVAVQTTADPDQGGMAFFVDNSVNTGNDLIEAMRIDEKGNVGIGTSSPSSGYKLDVVGNTILSSGYLVVSDSTWGINIQDNTPLTMGNGGDYSLGTDGSKSYWSVGTSLGSTTGITMDGSGNVGIGTTSPGSPLHVDSSSDSVPALRVTGGAGGVDMARFVRDEGANAEIKVHANSGEPQITWDRNSAGQLWSMGIDSTTDDFQIAEGASIGAGDVRMTFAEGGNVGIGTTSPSAELHVNSSGHTYSYISTSSGVSVAKLQLQNTADGTYGTISLDAGGLMHFGTEDSASTNHLVIDGSGQVGIGTASPSRELEINGTTDPSLLITDGTTELLLQAYTGNSGWIGTTTDDPLKFGANSSTRMTIDGAGSVGIGTVSPQNLLEIANANGAEMALRRVDTGIFGGNLLGNIKFTGDQDSTSIESASIRGIVNGNENWGAGDYPSDLQFWTTSDGSSTIAQRMVIRSSGNVGIGKGSPSSLLEVAGTFNASSNGGYVQVNSGGDVLIGI